MIDNHYLEKYQPIIYRTFINAINKKQISHAYLLSGEPGTPLLGCATYLAKSLICDNPSPLACNTCFSCLRLEEGNYADFILLDGSQKTIKKDDIQKIEQTFEKKALESKGVMIYIIHLVENMTIEAINSLLKFLEEPTDNIYAFLTTENEMKVLPTIISRTQRLPLKKMKQSEVINLCLEHEIAKEDAEILSFFYNDPLEIQRISCDDEYQLAKENVISFLTALVENENKAIYIMQKNISSVIKTKESARFFLDLLSIFLQEIVVIKGNQDSILESYVNILTSLQDVLDDINVAIMEIMNARSNLDLNVNIALLLDHIAFEITKGGN